VSTPLAAARASWRPLAPLLLAVAALLLASIGLWPLFDIDEGAFSEATREMLAGGDWLSTTLNGAPRWDKPILVYWLQAASVGLLGLNEFALRLPSALSALAWVALVARFAQERWGDRAGVAAGAVAATSLGPLAIGHAATADALLNALLAASVLDLWRHLEGGGRAPLLRAWACAGLGVLAKGPIALLIPGGATLVYALGGGAWPAVLRAGFAPAGWALCAAIALPWYLAEWHLHGRAFIDGFFVKHNLDRFGGPLEGHGGSVAYYLLVLPLLLLPWTPLLARILRKARASWRDEPCARFLLAWAGFVLVFFSLSGTKLPHYALYGATPLFLLLGREATRPAAGRGGTRAVALAAALACLAIALAPMMVQTWAGGAQGARTAFFAAQASRAGVLAGAGYYVLSGLALLATVACVLRAGPRAMLLAAGATAASFCFAFGPWAGEMLAGPVRDAGRLAAQLGGPAVTWDIGAPAFSVYRGDKMNHGPITLLRGAHSDHWVRLDGLATADDLRAHCRQRVARNLKDS